MTVSNVRPYSKFFRVAFCTTCDILIICSSEYVVRRVCLSLSVHFYCNQTIAHIEALQQLLIYYVLKHNNVKQLKYEKSANCNTIVEQFYLDLCEYYSVIFNKVLYFGCTSKTHRISLVYWNRFKCRFPSDTEFRWISS